APPRLCSSIATGGIVPPQRCTSVPLRRARRLSRASVPVRTPPWRRGCARKVRLALQPRRCLLWLCECELEFAASLPSPSIVAATGAGNHNLSSEARAADEWQVPWHGARSAFLRNTDCGKIGSCTTL